MIRKTITFRVYPRPPIHGEKITLCGEIGNSEQVIVTVRPPSSKQEHTYKACASSSSTSYICLRGGSPDAYATFVDWITSEDETLSHDFQYDESRPDPNDPNKFSVAIYANNNPIVEESEIDFDKRFARALPRTQSIDTPKPRASAHDLVHIGGRLDVICSKLLPELIKEVRQTRRAIACLALLPQANPAQVTIAECEPLPVDHDRKGHPSHPDQSH